MAARAPVPSKRGSSEAMAADGPLVDRVTPVVDSPASVALADRLTFLVHVASARVATIGNRHFREHDLNHFSARILVLLLEKKELRTGELGDLMVLRRGPNNKRLALLKVSLAGAVTALGGLLGYWLVEQLQDYLPYFLVVASSSFVYVALADLIPQLQKRLSARETAAQIAWLLVGIGLVTAVSGLAHAH